MRFFFSLEFRRNETQWKAMITVNQAGFGGGGSAPLTIRSVFFCFVLFFSNKITESKNLPTWSHVGGQHEVFNTCSLCNISSLI